MASPRDHRRRWRRAPADGTDCSAIRRGRAARATDLPHLNGFSNGLDLDIEAVTAALTLPHQNGRTEGVNTKTKMIKRQMLAVPASRSSAIGFCSAEATIRHHRKCDRAIFLTLPWSRQHRPPRRRASPRPARRPRWLPQLARQLATIDQMLDRRLTINIISSDLPGQSLESAPGTRRGCARSGAAGRRSISAGCPRRPARSPPRPRTCF
jgi:hypothetical protein